MRRGGSVYVSKRGSILISGEAKGAIATAGGCLASQYLAAWIIAKLAGKSSAESAIHYVAPVGEKESTVSHTMSVVLPYI